MVVPPSAAARTARTISSGAESFRRKPLAAWDRAVSMASSSSKEVSMTTAVLGWRERTRVSSSRPSMPGMRTSVSRTCTGTVRRKARASAARLKVEATSMRGEEDR